jgi:hypothetical protein
MSLLANLRRPLGGSLVLFTVVAALGGCGTTGARVASVDGHPVALATFRHWLEIVAAESAEPDVGVPDPPRYAACVRQLRSTGSKGATKPTAAALASECASRYRVLTEATLGFLIPAEWLLAEARHLGVAVSDAAVKREFLTAVRQRYPHAAEFERFLRQTRYTVSDVLLRVKLGLVSAAIRRKVVEQHARVNDAEVARYYDESKVRFGVPETRSVYLLRTKSEKAARSAKQQIESGRSFSSVARRVSLDPSGKASGGLLREVTKGQHAAALDRAVFAAAPNVLSGPIRTPLGYYVLSVKSVTAATQPPLSKIESQVKQQLVYSNQSRALSSFIADFQKRWIKRTSCSSAYVVMQCRQYKGARRE